MLAIEGGVLEENISTLVISEVLSGFYVDKKDKDASGFLSAILANENFRVVPLSSDIAASSAIIMANKRLKLLDAMVLATAAQLHVDFLVSNDERFPENHQNVSHVTSKEISESLK
ncbi:MAG: type II toxin-antitoxin system VapC family toxin [Thermoplasmataceae archaeon]